MSSYRLNYSFRESDARDYTYSYSHQTNGITITKGTNTSNINTNSNSNTYHLSSTSIPKKSIVVTTASLKILDQGSLGSCVSNAISLSINIITNNKINLSRLYLYFNGRALGNQPLQEDNGLNIKDGVNSIVKYGLCSESVYPYDIQVFAKLPSLNVYKIASYLPNFSYYFITGNIINSLRSVLGTILTPVIFGAQIYSSFLTDTVAITGYVPIPDTLTETLEGGHCMTIIGYDDNKKVFICANSWGTSWGQKGLCYMPYDYIANNQLCSDFCVIRILKK